MNWIRSTVLDADQLIAGSRDAQARAWVDALQSFGIHTLNRRVRPMMGLDEGTVLRRLTGIPESSPAGRRVTQSRWLIFRSRYLPSLRPCPEARAALERLIGEGLRVVVATSGSETDLQLVLDCAEVADLSLTRVATGNPVRRSPGSPLAAAARSLRESAGTIAAIVDTPHEVGAALTARLTPIALRSGGWDERMLDGAAAIVDDLADLVERYDATPFAAGVPDPMFKLAN